MRIWSIAAAFSAAVAFTACTPPTGPQPGAGQSPSPVPTTSPVGSASPRTSPSPAAGATPTASPAATPTPSPSATPTPTPGPTFRQQAAVTGVLNAVQFLDDKTGFAVGSNRTVLKTTDGGESWATLSTSGFVDTAEDEGFRALSFVNAQTGWILSYNAIYKTTDGGTTWTSQAQEGMQKLSGFKSLQFISATTGVVAADNAPGDPEVFTTADGGATWQPHADVPALLFTAAAGETIAASAGTDGFYQFTPGTGWAKRSAVTGNDNSDLWFLTKSLGWALSPSGLRRTTNGGGGWETVRDLAGATPVAVHFLDDERGWLLLSDSLLQTADAGKTWTTTQLPASIQRQATNFWMTDDKTGWIVSSNGRIIHYGVR